MLIGYIVKRIVQVIPLLLAISVIVFIIINLPPGDYLTTYIRQLELSGTEVSQSQIENMKRLYSLDKPMYMQYLTWMRNIITKGDFGRSFSRSLPVTEVIGERIGATMLMSLSTLIFSNLIIIPVGIYSAIRQYSLFDYIFMFIGFIGMAVPGFLIALFIIYTIFKYTGNAITGLFSQQYQTAPWSWAKFVDMLKHVWVALLVIGLANTANGIRSMRAMVLDELQKQYVVTARSKGVQEGKLLWKYPIRMALNPMMSTIGWMLPGLISGETIVSIVLNLPTSGPVLFAALQAQDMYLAGSFLVITSVLTVVGTLISDIALAMIDPRIRFGGVSE